MIRPPRFATPLSGSPCAIRLRRSTICTSSSLTRAGSSAGCMSAGCRSRSSIFIAAIFTWFEATPTNTFIATATLVGAIFFTGASFLWTEVNRKPLTKGFLYGQLVFDLLVVTAVVHVTTIPEKGAQFAALYILVNAAAALMLPIGGALLIAALGLVVYAFDAIAVSGFSNVHVAPAVRVLDRRAQHGLHQRATAAGGSGTRAARRRAHARATAREGHSRQHQERHRDGRRDGRAALRESERQRTARPRPRIAASARRSSRQSAPFRPCLPTRSIIPSRDHSNALRAEGEIIRIDRTFPFGVTTTSADGDGARGRAEHHGDFSGYLRPEAPRAAEPSRAAPRSGRRAVGIARARNQESARVDSQRRRADVGAPRRDER